MTMKVDVSVGELLDKITILEIKFERIKEAEKLQNVRKELDLLKSIWEASSLDKAAVAHHIQELKRVNNNLWDIEDKVRQKEATESFDDEFIELARSVYKNNDERAELKRDINRLLGSDLVEEKSYPDYSQANDPTEKA